MSDHTDMSRRTMVLATDLDGTFLGGTDTDRDRLYAWIGLHRPSVGLIFVTGRDPEFIAGLCEAGRVPWPDYVVGDVGTTIARLDTQRRIQPIHELELEIAATWNDRGDTVRQLLAGHPGLTLQPTGFRYRVSYDYVAGAVDDATIRRIEALGVDVLISDNRFLDVLPKGISKGPSLVRLLDHLGVAHEQVLIAGDTLNDHSMLIAGPPAVAVGGSEAALLSALPDAPQIHRAVGVGAAGIWEAIGHFSLHHSLAEV